MIKFISFNLFCLIIPLLLFGQEIQTTGTETDSKDTPSVITTDRPTQAISPFLVPKGAFQIESGFIFQKESNDVDDINTYDIAATVLRYGVFDNFELRAAGYYRINEVYPLGEAPDSSIYGFGPLSLGCKVHIVNESGWLPELALIADITFRHFGEDGYHPTFSFPTASFVASHTPGRFSLVYNAGVAYNGENADGFFIYSLVLGYKLYKGLSIFIEPYGNFDHGNAPNHKIDAGLIYLIRHNLQVDFSAGIGLSNTIDKNFAELGVSWRIPR